MNTIELGERLQSLRKARGFSQEQLADLMGVSRQAVSKWESGASQPDIGNFLRLSELYGETLDALIKGTDSGAEPQGVSGQSAACAGCPAVRWLPHEGWRYEYKSKRTLWGLPLVHVLFSIRRRGLLSWGSGFEAAKGIIAIGTMSVGLVSIGVFSMGLFSLGVFTLGLLAMGLVAFGAVSAGIVSFGLLALGVVTIGVYCHGVVAMGRVAVGVASVGRVAIGVPPDGASGTHVLLDDNATGEQVRQFIRLYEPNLPGWLLRCITLFLG